MKNIIVSLILTGLLFLLGCGGAIDLGPGGSVSAPEDATITISPSSVTVKDGRSSSYWDTQYFFITVKNKNGIPLPDVEIRMYYIWAAPASSYVVQFYEGDTPVNSAHYAVTDENGTYKLRFDFMSGGGLEYKADLEVTSGPLYASAPFEVKVPE